MSYSPLEDETEQNYDHHLLIKADDRREKMEALLEKLSERFEKRKESQESKEDALDEEIQETEKQTDKMKVMIDNLKHRLAQSRPGVSHLDTKNLDEPINI